MDIQTFPGFLTAEQCADWRERIRTIEAANFTDTGKFTNKKWEDLDLATAFHTRLVELDPSTRYKRANNLIMAGLYKPGDSFGLHTDTGLYYNRVAGEESRWTLLIYLNTVQEGGETVFYSTEGWKEVLRIKPEEGKALLFDIDLWHCGEPIVEGEKLWIGCEIIGEIVPIVP